VAAARSSSGDNATRCMHFRLVDDVIASHKKACAVYGVAYGREMSVSGRQRRDGPGFSDYVQVNADSNSKAPFTRYNLLSKRLLNRFDNRLYRVHKHSTCCQTGFDNRLNEQWLFVQHGCQTGLTTGWMFVYTIQLVVKTNRLYRVNGV